MELSGPVMPARLDTPAFLAEDLGPMLIALASTFIVFSTTFVGLRYYARYLTNTRFGVEDIIIPFAWLAEIGLCITAIVMVKKAGTGRHQDYILNHYGPETVTEHYKGIMVNEVLHLPAVAFPKLCVVILYLRVFTNKWARIATWSLIYVIAGTWFSYTIATMFQCMPFSFNWDKSIPNGRCFNVVAFGTSSSVPNIFTDVAVLFLPLKTVLDLKVSTGRKLGLAVIFLTGSVGIIASIIRTVVFATGDPLVDTTYNHVELIKWTIIEPGLYLIAACALSFKPLFRIVAHALHLDALITHSETRKDGLTTSTFKSSGFRKLGAKNGGASQEQADGTQGKGGVPFNIVVTKTWETDVEAWSARDGGFEMLERGEEEMFGSVQSGGRDVVKM